MSDLSDSESIDYQIRSFYNPSPPEDGPYLEIIEEPQSKGFRFRYACEGKSHGGLQGANHRKDKKTVPTVKINRYSGMARLEVTLVTDEEIPRHHAHELIGKNCENGKCVVNVKGDNPIVGFPNLGIKHITKKNLVNVLMDKLRESLKIEKLFYGSYYGNVNDLVLTDFEEEDIKRKAEEQSKSLQMSVVRLKFQAYLINDAGLTKLLPPVYSAQIYDKAPRASLLKICRMDRVSGCCAGNDEVFLLCDKVQKDDISVRFFEQDEEGNVIWEDYGVFSPQDVHRQYAIVFRTPSYPDNKIKNSQSVFVQLKRLSDGEVSDPKTFTYFPKQQDITTELHRKKRRHLSSAINSFDGPKIEPNFLANSCAVDSEQLSPLCLTNEFQSISYKLQEACQDFAHTHNQQQSYSLAKAAEEFHHSQQFNQNHHLPQQHLGQQQDLHHYQQQNKQPYLQKPFATTINQQIPLPVTENYLDFENLNWSNTDSFLMGRGLPNSTLSSSALSLTSSTIMTPSSSCPGLVAIVPSSIQASVQTSSTLLSLQTTQPTTSSTSSTSSASLPSSTDTFSSSSSLLLSPASQPSPLMTTGSSTATTSPPAPPTTCPDASSSLIKCYSVKQEDNKTQNSQISQNSRDVLIKCLQLYSCTEDVRFLIWPLKSLINEQNLDGDNSLHLSVLHEKTLATLNLLSMLKYISLKQAIVNQKNFLLQTPLFLAVVTNQTDQLQLLLTNGAKLNESANGKGDSIIHVATKMNHDECLHILLNQPASNEIIDQYNYSGKTALHIASSNGYYECMKLLLQFGAGVNIHDQLTGKTALMFAVENNHLSMTASLLLEKNIDVNAQSFQGNTALHIATASKNLKIIALLVAAGSDCNIKNSDVKQNSSGCKSSDDSESCSEWINADDDLSSAMYRKCRLNESDSSSEDENDTNKGMTARDYSFGDEKILNLLDGKTYDEVVKERVADVQTGTALDSHLKPLDSNFDSGLGSLSLPDHF